MVSDCLIVDEVFSATDHNGIDKYDTLFSYIKSKYKWCVTITHNDMIKDKLDKLYTIDTKKKYSSISII